MASQRILITHINGTQSAFFPRPPLCICLMFTLDEAWGSGCGHISPACGSLQAGRGRGPEAPADDPEPSGSPGPCVDQPCTREWRGSGARLGAGWPTPSSDLMAALGFGATIILLTGGETEALGG